jgi:hypothetical protein
MVNTECRAYEKARAHRESEKFSRDEAKAQERGKYRAMPVREKIGFHTDKAAETFGHTARALHDSGVRPVAIAGELHRAGRVLILGPESVKPRKAARKPRRVKASTRKTKARKSKVTKSRKSVNSLLVQGLPRYRIIDSTKFKLRNIFNLNEEEKAISMIRALNSFRVQAKIEKAITDTGKQVFAVYEGPKDLTRITFGINS